MQRTPTSAVSPHLVDPTQAVLFDARRDWRCFTVGSSQTLPTLTPAAEALLEEFERHARKHGWNASPRNSAAMTLRILLGWLGAEAPSTKPTFARSPTTGATPASDESCSSSTVTAWSSPTPPAGARRPSERSSSASPPSPTPSPRRCAAGFEFFGVKDAGRIHRKCMSSRGFRHFRRRELANPRASVSCITPPSSSPTSSPTGCAKPTRNEVTVPERYRVYPQGAGTSTRPKAGTRNCPLTGHMHQADERLARQTSVPTADSPWRPTMRPPSKSPIPLAGRCLGGVFVDHSAVRFGVGPRVVRKPRSA